MGAAEVDAADVWLPLFPATRGYVYASLPPATTVGHRAETWDVENPLAEVTVRVLAADEAARVLLEDTTTGAVFAECPVPADRPLVTVVEPVIDSSRYYVLRVEDGASGRHAFLGLGFGSRGESSDFNAALSEHRAYIQRKRQAEETRREWEEAAAAAAGGDAAGAGEGTGAEVATGGMAAPVGSALHSSLERPGEALKLRLAIPPAAGPDGERRGGFVSSRLAAESADGSQGAALDDGSSRDGQRRLPLLRPPPGKLTPPAPIPGQALLPAHAHAGSTPGDDGSSGDWGDFLG